MLFFNRLNHYFMIVWDGFSYSTKLSGFSLKKNKTFVLIMNSHYGKIKYRE